MSTASCSAASSQRGRARTVLVSALLALTLVPASLWALATLAEEGERPPDPWESVAASAVPGAGADPGPPVSGTVPPSGARPAAAPAPTDTRPRLDATRSRPRARSSAPPRSVPATLALLRKTRGWTRHLEAWLTLPPAADAAERARRRTQVLDGLVDPVVRQNTIFLAALTEPWDEVRPWLEGLRAGKDSDDAEDALCALAFSGEAEAAGAFRALARMPSATPVHRLVDTLEAHDAIAAEGTREAREALRAWRSIEALDRSPYFERVAFVASHVWTPGDLLHWQPRSVEPATRKTLLKAWLDRYPGHPGSDNMAVRLGRLEVAEGDFYAAARWFALALALPDQAEAWPAAAALVALCETLLRPEQILALANDGGREAPSRTVLLYAHARRLAAGVGVEAACRAVQDLGTHEPDLVLAAGWNNRWSVDPPAGLTSGVEPLAPDDRLFRVEAEAAPWPAPRMHEEGWQAWPAVWARTWNAEGRLSPPRDPGVLDRDRLMRQLRAWDTLAELERRGARARGNVRADLLYKQAAVLYHDRDALFPCYEDHTLSFRRLLRFPCRSDEDVPGGEEAERRRLERFGGETYAWERAAVLFQRLEHDHPRYPAMDKVLFSEGMCWKRLVDYRPRSEWASRRREDPQDEAVQAVRRCVACFEQLVREFPTSTLADDAARAAAWWRRARPEAWGESAR